MPIYSEIYVNETSAQRFCTDCGVLVVDDKAHDRFHEGLTKMNEAAHRYTEPPRYA